MIGVFAFGVFSVASMAQLVVGRMLDQHGARSLGRHVKANLV